MSDEPGPEPLEIDPHNPSGAIKLTPTRLISDDVWGTATSDWINDRVRNSPIAQSTDAWNRLMGVLPDLRNYLETELNRSK